MRRLLYARRMGAVLAVLISTAPSAGAGTTVPFTCHTVPLETTIGRSNTAVWSRDGASLWIADVKKAKLLQLTASGNLLRTVARPGWGRFEFQNAGSLILTDTGYLLNDSVSHFIWFDAQMEPVRAVDFRFSSPQRDFAGTIGLLDQTAVDDELIGFGVIKQADEKTSWWGYFRLQVEPEVQVRDRIEEVSTPREPMRYVGINLPVIAQAAGAAWGLAYREPPAIIRLTPPYGQLETFPLGFETLPQLPTITPRTGPLRYGIVEQSTLPTALYGDGDYLYLVTRRAQPAGKTLWQLSQIDPRKDRLLRTLTLPTDTNHLVLAPGAERWAVLEKGSLGDDNTQPIPSMLLLPAHWITDPEATQDDLALPCQ